MLERIMMWLYPRRTVRHVSMAESASPYCKYCAGTGWVREDQDRCMSVCSCVSMSETIRGNN